jgi:hypothetical protein
VRCDIDGAFIGPELWRKLTGMIWWNHPARWITPGQPQRGNGPISAGEADRAAREHGAGEADFAAGEPGAAEADLAARELGGDEFDHAAGEHGDAEVDHAAGEHGAGETDRAAGEHGAGEQRYGGKFWKRSWKAGRKKPWLMAALVTKFRLREVSASGSLGLFGIAKGTITLTFERPSVSRGPGQALPGGTASGSPEVGTPAVRNS